MTALAVTAATLHLPGPAPDGIPVEPAQEAKEVLGRKGLLGKEPATRLALCAVHRALGRPLAAPRPQGPADPDTAVIVCSNLGNVGTVSEIARQVESDGVRAVSPMDAPNASSNVIASAIAIWFRFGGPNVTLCSGATAGLDAVWLAGLLLRARRARKVLLVGVEPDDPDAARLHRRRAGATPGVPLRAGAACLLVEPADAVSHPLAVLDPPTAPANAAPVIETPGASIDPLARIGDTYGAAGLVYAAVAIALVGPHGTARVVCGDPVDGWRELQVHGGAG